MSADPRFLRLVAFSGLPQGGQLDIGRSALKSATDGSRLDIRLWHGSDSRSIAARYVHHHKFDG